MLCYRQGLNCATIDTNNFIESWHNTLKRHFFKDQQKRRVDMVVYILAKMAIPHFQYKVMRSVVKVGRMDPSQKIELQATRRAKVRLAELESKGLKGWSQVSAPLSIYIPLFSQERITALRSVSSTERLGIIVLAGVRFFVGVNCAGRLSSCAPVRAFLAGDCCISLGE
jgi:hypothetical protein